MTPVLILGLGVHEYFQRLTHNRIERTLAIYHEFAQQDLHQELIALSFEADTRLWEEGDELPDTLADKIKDEDSRDQTRFVVTEFLKTMQTLYLCVHGTPAESPSRVYFEWAWVPVKVIPRYCQADSARVFFADTARYIFWNIRFLIYCDPRIWDALGPENMLGDKFTPIEMTEKLVFGFMEEEERALDADLSPLFVTHEQRRTAGFGEGGEYRVIRVEVDDERCVKFRAYGRAKPPLYMRGASL